MVSERLRGHVCQGLQGSSRAALEGLEGSGGFGTVRVNGGKKHYLIKIGVLEFC